MRAEERASAIDKQILMTAIGVILYEICEKEEAAEEEDKTKEEKHQSRKRKCCESEVRSLCRTRKEMRKRGLHPKKGRRILVMLCLSYLQEKSKQEELSRKEKIELKKQEEGRVALLAERQPKMNKKCYRWFSSSIQISKDNSKNNRDSTISLRSNYNLKLCIAI